MLFCVLCNVLEAKIRSDLTVQTHLHVYANNCRETIFLAEILWRSGDPVSMETSNYLTQKNNSRARGVTHTQSENQFVTQLFNIY